MTKASLNAVAVANLDLVVAHVGATESDVMELNAPVGAFDAADNDGVDDHDGGRGGDDGVPEQLDAVGDVSATDVAVSETSSILSEEAGSSSEQSLPSTTDDDTDSIDSDHEGTASRRVVTIGVSTSSQSNTTADAIVGGDDGAEADANAVPEVGPVENRLNESVPWEDYVAPAPDGDDGDDGGDDDGDDDDDDDFAGLGPVDRARLHFRRSLESKLHGFRATGVAEPLLIQQLTHG